VYRARRSIGLVRHKREGVSVVDKEDVERHLPVTAEAWSASGGKVDWTDLGLVHSLCKGNRADCAEQRDARQTGNAHHTSFHRIVSLYRIVSLSGVRTGTYCSSTMSL